jgi:hypothetical protein
MELAFRRAVGWAGSGVPFGDELIEFLQNRGCHVAGPSAWSAGTSLCVPTAWRRETVK